MIVIIAAKIFKFNLNLMMSAKMTNIAMTTTHTTYKLICERENGQKTASFNGTRNKDELQRLADTLNRRFSHRRYFIEPERPARTSPSGNK
ncbi:MAG TPA: hypothetical protein VF692_13710 [Pyrinomonadaceae bacterium]